jgi:hypothetical protein
MGLLRLSEPPLFDDLLVTANLMVFFLPIDCSAYGDSYSAYFLRAASASRAFATSDFF